MEEGNDSVSKLKKIDLLNLIGWVNHCQNLGWNVLPMQPFKYGSIDPPTYSRTYSGID